MSQDHAQLAELVKPFADSVVKENPSGGGVYVPHSMVVQKLIASLGHPPDFEIIDVIRGDAFYRVTENGGSVACLPHLDAAHQITNAVVGCTAVMSFKVDGEPVTIVETGDCENPANWKTDGARLKDAASDAYKRCAMRAGVGLHLWTKSDQPYVLDQRFPTATVAAAPEPTEEAA